MKRNVGDKVKIKNTLTKEAPRQVGFLMKLLIDMQIVFEVNNDYANQSRLFRSGAH
jgi:hypothetical protein